MRVVLAGLAALALAGCGTPHIVSDVTPPLPPVATPDVTMKSFGASVPLPPQRSNTEMARDFLDLVFQLESGQPLAVFTRFEGPLSVAVTGIPSTTMNRELDRLLDRLRNEAGLSLTRIDDPASAAITVEGVAFRDLQRIAPQAACIVLPTRTTLAQFRATPRSPNYTWTTLTTRKAATVMIPVDRSPQDVRDCLHEEIAQALAPLNDLYRLEDSTFNDDDMNVVLTGFDMLMLRAAYHPSLHSGMSRDEVAARLPGILAALNPRGNTIAARADRPSPAYWTGAMNEALGAPSASARRSAARKALTVAQGEGWNDSRTALCHYALARAEISRDGDVALENLLLAAEIYKRRDATAIHAAHVGFQIAAFALGSGQWDVAIQLAERYEPVARRAENAALLSDLTLARAAALAAKGAPAEEVRTEGLGWGVYALGSGSAARARAAEIDRLAARAGA